MKKNKNFIRGLIDKLNYYTKLYDEGIPAISDYEWDNLYFQLVELEKQTGIYYPDSPTQSINYQVVNGLNKVTHNHKMLSLAKTKNIDGVKDFLKDQDFVAMAKMDGLTCSLLYEDGKLISAETRGNGIVGEDVTHNAQVVKSIPKRIQYKDKLVVDGEIVCLDGDFKPFSAEYKNSRNFASGSIRLLNNQECAKRNLTFIAWDLIEGYDSKSFLDGLIFLSKLGFMTVPWIQENPSYAINDLQIWCAEQGYPIDGIVFKFNDIEYGKSLGETAHHFNNAIAYKFADEEFETRLLNIEWSMGRTGQICPIAVFEPLDIDGSEISRASLHNLKILKETLGNHPFKDQIIYVAKRNQIIPQITKAKDEFGQWIQKI